MAGPDLFAPVVDTFVSCLFTWHSQDRGRRQVTSFGRPNHVRPRTLPLCHHPVRVLNLSSCEPFLDVEIKSDQREDHADGRRVRGGCALSDVRINNVLEYEILSAHRIDVELVVFIHRIRNFSIHCAGSSQRTRFCQTPSRPRCQSNPIDVRKARAIKADPVLLGWTRSQLIVAG